MAKYGHNNNSEELNLIDAFYQRLISAYGYSEEQLGRSVTIGTGAEADIAIWRTPESKHRQSIPDICVVVICREEHIKNLFKFYINN